MKFIKFSLIILLVFSSCSYLLKKKYQIKKPKLENLKSINNYLSKKGMDTTHSLYIKDFKSFAEITKSMGMIIPNAYFFNKEGNFVSYKKKAEDCTAKITPFFSELNHLSELPFETNKKQDSFEQLLMPNSVIKNKKSNSTITVFITWAIYTGKLNDENAFSWIELVEKAKKNGIKIDYYLVNCDFQESWQDFKDVMID